MSNVPMTRPEELLSEYRSTHHHSSFVQLAGGRIMQSSAGLFSVSDDGGITWSESSPRSDRNGDPVGGAGTSLVRLSGESIGVAAIGGRASVTVGETLAQRAKRMEAGRRTSHMRFWRSDDSGETWQPPVRITPEGFPSSSLHDTLLRTSSGRLVLPSYLMLGKNTGPNDEKPPRPGGLVDGHFVGVTGHWFDPHGPSCVFVNYSDDDGKTWQRNDDGEIIILLDWNATFTYVNEATVTEVSPGCLLMMMRTQMGRLYQAWSYDDGETWTRPQPTSLASSTTPAQIRTLPNGHILIVWNQEGTEEIRRGLSRQRISTAVSRNRGSVWEFFQNVESIFEETRVEPGPIQRYQPEEIYFESGSPSPVRPSADIVPSVRKGIWSYPSMLILEDRVIVSYGYQTLHWHPTKAQLQYSRDEGFRTKTKVLPLTWFYGGNQPADNPMLS